MWYVHVYMQVIRWHVFAAEQIAKTNTRAFVEHISSDPRNAQRAEKHGRDGKNETGRRGQAVVWGQQSRSMFDQLARKPPPHAKSPSNITLVPVKAAHDNTYDSATDAIAPTERNTCVEPQPPRKLKTRLVKQHEKIEAKNKRRKATWYNLPEGARLVAADQSTHAARNALVFTALAEVH